VSISHLILLGKKSTTGIHFAHKKNFRTQQDVESVGKKGSRQHATKAGKGGNDSLIN